MNYIRHLNIFWSLVRRDQTLTSAHLSLYLALFQYWNMNRFQNPLIAHRQNIMGLCKIGSKNTYHKCLKELHEARYIYCQPGLNKFQPLKIRIINLDKNAGENNVIQLNFFEAPLPPISIKNDTLTVPNLVLYTSPNMGHGKVKCDTVPVPNLIPGKVKIGTVPVPNMGHIYKLNNNKLNSVCNTPTDFFSKTFHLKKNEKEKIQDTGPAPKIEDEAPPDLPAVESFFREQNYPLAEAKKFFLYNEGKAWMFSSRLRIQDWQALAHKWMLNASRAPNLIHSCPSATHDVNQEKNYGEPL